MLYTQYNISYATQQRQAIQIHTISSYKETGDCTDDVRNDVMYIQYNISYATQPVSLVWFEA